MTYLNWLFWNLGQKAGVWVIIFKKDQARKITPQMHQYINAIMPAKADYMLYAQELYL